MFYFSDTNKRTKLVQTFDMTFVRCIRYNQFRKTITEGNDTRRKHSLKMYQVNGTSVSL